MSRVARLLPVDGGVVRALVRDLDDDPIIFLGVNDRAGEHTIDGDDVLGLAQLRDPRRLHLRA